MKQHQQGNASLRANAPERLAEKCCYSTGILACERTYVYVYRIWKLTYRCEKGGQLMNCPDCTRAPSRACRAKVSPLASKRV